MGTVRLARDLGTVEQLLPKHITSIIDLPYTVAEAIQRALTWLSFEELEESERPPRRIWQDDSKLKEWFAMVKKRREEKFGGKSTEIEDPVQNEAAKGLLVG